MANNVFGDPITDSSLTQMERAREALNQKAADGKDVSARRFVEDLKRQYGNGVSALCLVYNATGNAITFADFRDWYGQIWRSPYPQRIQNGQWGAFLHVKRTAAATGSMAAAVYRGRDGNGNNCDYMMSWMHPWGAISNSVCTQARETDYFKAQWDTIYSLLERNGRQDSDYWNGCWTTISTGTEKSALVQAIFTLEEAARLGSDAARVDSDDAARVDSDDAAHAARVDSDDAARVDS